MNSPDKGRHGKCITEPSAGVGTFRRRGHYLSDAIVMSSVSLLEPRLTAGRSLRRAFTRAKYFLGRRMFREGIDDGHLGARIAEAVAELRQVHEAGEPTRPLRARLARLYVRLAEAALEFDAPLPGANAAYRAARRAETALRRFEEAAA